MSIKLHYILLLLVFFISQATFAQYDPDKVCRIENGALIFSINLKWTEAEKKDLIQRFELDSMVVQEVFNGKSEIIHNGETWKVKKLNSNIIELSKPVESAGEKAIERPELIPLIDQWMNFTGEKSIASVTYGFNDFGIAHTFLYSNGKAWIFLPGYLKAKNMILSGSFNNWSTSQLPMKRRALGWTAELKLQPGKYAYKFIVDGKWMLDPNNKIQERDETGISNSIFFCDNYRFKLKGYREARKVVVTGNFYNWNPKGIPLKKREDGWSLPVYLRDGTHVYKFLVDNQWITDPDNPDTREDGDGNKNSFISIGEPYNFKLPGFATAEKVILTGNFNGWNESELKMNKTKEGWQLPYVIPSGNYEYKFIIDGKWSIDPENPFTTGTGNYTNSIIALRANHIFVLNKFTEAKSVIVTGSFNGWNKEGYRMVQKDGKWIFPIFLSPGKYTYKFIVDENWIIDPSNSVYEQNEYDTKNSVLWIEP